MRTTEANCADRWDRTDKRQGHLQLVRALQHCLRHVQQQHLPNTRAPPSQPPHHILTCGMIHPMPRSQSAMPLPEARPSSRLPYMRTTASERAHSAGNRPAPLMTAAVGKSRLQSARRSTKPSAIASCIQCAM
jgi:hypothetical protein